MTSWYDPEARAIEKNCAARANLLVCLFRQAIVSMYSAPFAHLVMVGWRKQLANARPLGGVMLGQAVAARGKETVNAFLSLDYWMNVAALAKCTIFFAVAGACAAAVTAECLRRHPSRDDYYKLTGIIV